MSRVTCVYLRTRNIKKVMKPNNRMNRIYFLPTLIYNFFIRIEEPETFPFFAWKTNRTVQCIRSIQLEKKFHISDSSNTPSALKTNQ